MPISYKRTARLLTTTQVARVLGITKKTLYRMMQDGRVPEPPRNPDNNYRIWSSHEVEQLREVLSR